MQKHEDDRRIIYDYASGNFKSAKAVIVKKRIPIGDHYHLNKDEEFFLLHGEFIKIQVGEDIRYNVKAPHYVFVKRNTYHKFICEEGSILLGTATEPFDINDEIKKP